MKMKLIFILTSVKTMVEYENEFQFKEENLFER